MSLNKGQSLLLSAIVLGTGVHAIPQSYSQWVDQTLVDPVQSAPAAPYSEQPVVSQEPIYTDPVYSAPPASYSEYVPSQEPVYTDPIYSAPPAESAPPASYSQEPVYSAPPAYSESAYLEPAPASSAVLAKRQSEIASAVPEPVSSFAPDPAVSSAIPEPISSAAPEPISSALPEPVSSLAPEPISSALPEPVSSLAPEPISSALPEPVSSLAPEPISSAAPEPISSATPEPISSLAPEPVSSAAPEPIVSDNPPVEVSSAPAVPTFAFGRRQAWLNDTYDGYRKRQAAGTGTAVADAYWKRQAEGTGTAAAGVFWRRQAAGTGTAVPDAYGKRQAVGTGTAVVYPYEKRQVTETYGVADPSPYSKTPGPGYGEPVSTEVATPIYWAPSETYVQPPEETQVVPPVPSQDWQTLVVSDTPAAPVPTVVYVERQVSDNDTNNGTETAPPANETEPIQTPSNGTNVTVVEAVAAVPRAITGFWKRMACALSGSDCRSAAEKKRANLESLCSNVNPSAPECEDLQAEGKLM